MVPENSGNLTKRSSLEALWLEEGCNFEPEKVTLANKRMEQRTFGPC